ncbi:MAG: hypothetical protein Q4C70_03200, partial [Planctomycetia bacterium]|nr:hypothetical protein [Planctomycetia bacterium]
MTLNNVKITENVTTSANSNCGGGGIYVAYGTSLTMTDCEISGNSSLGKDGGDCYGGAILSSGALNLKNVNIVGNYAEDNGGAIADYAPANWSSVPKCPRVYDNVRMTGNYTTGWGGAIYDGTGSTTGTITIQNSVITGNEAVKGGDDLCDNSKNENTATYNVFDVSNSVIGTISGRGSSSEVEVAYVKNNENGNAIGVEASAIFTTWETPTTTNTGVNYDSSKISAETIPMETPETGTMYRFVGVSKNTLTEHPDISTYYQIGDVAYPKTYVEAYASFEEAIDAANNGDTIIYLGTKDTITLNSEITIDKALTIDGNGVTIDRGLGNMVIDANADHVANGHIFVITTAAGTTMTLKNMTLTGACQYDDNSYGGAIDFKGGNLVCTNVNFTNNRAIAGGVGAQGTDPKYSSNIGQGGAINMSGEDLTLTNCTFDNNDATRAGSCIYFSGGQKGNPYTLTMTDCEVKNSDASSASWHTNSGGWGTVYLNGGSLVADKVNFTNNKTVAQGSAYAVESYTGSVDIKNSTIEGNTQNIGAVVSVWCEPTSVNIENTKIINNTVTTGTAKDAGLGGLAVAQADSLTISDSTITGNTAADMDADLYVASTVTNVNTNASSNTIGSNLSSASDVVVSVSKGSYTVNDNEIIIAEDGDYAFSMPEGATAADVSIVVKDGVTANITLNNVNLAPTDAAAMSIIEGSTVNLTLKGENTLKGDDVTSGGGYAAIHVEGIALDYSGNPIDPNAHHASLTITEDSGTDLTADKEANPNGKLLAIGGWATSYGHGAGIGSNAGKGAGNITINGGYIEAYDGITYEDKINNTENKNKYWWGAPAIGCAGYTSGHTFATSEVTISNGVVYAWGGPCAAAIGDGNNVSATDITITGGLVNAYACKANVDGSTAAAGAAIGAGDNGTNGYISITGGTVNAYSEAGAGIGSGNGAGCSDISITGGTVTAIGGSFTSGNTIYGAAGIGNGIGTGWAGSYQSGTIFIGKDATVYAKAGGSTLEDGADIGLSSLHGSNVLEGWITVIYEEGANIYQDSTGTKASIGFNGDEQNSYVAVQTENSDGIAGIQYKFWNHSAVGYDMEINPVSTRDCTIYAVPGSAFMIGETYYIAKTEPDADNMIITFKDGVVVDVQNEKEIVTQIVPEAGNRIHFVATTLPELEEIAGGEYYRINGDVYWKGYVNATVYDTLEELEAALDDFQVDKDGNPTNEPVIKAGDTVIIGGSYIASETETFTLNKDLVFRNDNTKDNGVAKIVNLGSINLTDGASLTIDENLVVNSLTAGNVTVTKATNLTMKEGDITLTVENFVVNSEGSVEITSGNVNVTGKGEVTINGTENNDVVSVGANTINVDGVSSTTFTDFTGSKTVKGNEGNDVVVVDSAVTENISIEGNDGNDVIISSGTAVTIDGGTGSDLIIDGTVTKLDSVKKWTSNASYAKALELYATGAIVKSSLTNTATINTGDSDTTLDIVFALEEEEETDLITMGTEDLLFPQHVEKTKGVIVVTTGDAQYWGMDDEHITLNEAIAWTNASTVYNTIGFAVDVNNVVVGGNLLTITDTLTIDGASKYDEFGVKSEVTTFAASDVVIDGQNTYSLFNIAAGETVSMNDLTITGGVGTTIPNDSNEAEKWGGGIYNAGTLTLTNIDITNNTATYGGGVYNKGTMTINGTSKISNNSSYQGGGIYNVGSKLHLTGATITGNEASGDGGGLWHVGQNYVYLNGVTIDQNSAINGGGVYNGGRIQLEGSYSSYGIQTKITNNTATGYGGGIYNKFSFVPGSSHTFMTISGNKASNGGGVYTTSSFSAKADINRNEATDGDGGGVYNTAALTLSSGSTISGNTTTRNGGGIYNNNQHSAGIVDAKISNNHADTGNGGGIYNSNQTNHPSNQKMELENTVISNNKASQNGGGIWNEVDNNVTLTNVTISGNNAELGGGVYNEGAVTI